MIQIILSHWATYLFLLWAVVIVVALVWLRVKPSSPQKKTLFLAKGADRKPRTGPIEDEFNLAHRDR